MALFPGDMNIGWGFGLYPEHCTGSPTCQCSQCRLIEHNSGEAPEDQVRTEEIYNGFMYVSVPVEEKQDEPHLTDPLLAVSELEERTESALDFIGTQLQAQQQRITDLEERLRSLCIVVNSLVERGETQERVLKDFIIARIGREEKA